MATTTNLGLQTFDTTSGSATTFLNFRLALADATSNMSIIDNFAGQTSACLINLQANAPVTYVPFTRVSGDYYTATVSSITAYTTNMIILASFNVANSSTTTVNINGLGVVTVRKYGIFGLGNLSAKDIRENVPYLMRYDGTYFVVSSGAMGTMVTMGGATTDNIVSINSSMYITDSGYGFGGESGVALLTTGSIPTANLGGGTASASSILYGDHQWKPTSSLPPATFTSSTSAITALKIRSSGSSQTANMLEVQSGASAVLFAIAANGRDFVLNSASGTSIGTSGSQKLGFYGQVPITQPTVTGSTTGSEAINNLLTVLANLGLIVKSTT